MSKQWNIFYQDGFVYFIAIAISILLTFWLNSQADIINPDAICYLSSAEAIGKYGLKSAMELCSQAKWPFYSFLIYHFSKLFFISITTAAYFLNGCFSAISVLAFILIVKELGGSRRVLWFAAITILFAHTFNTVREYIIRDHGFWAFYLLSLFFLLRFFKRPQWSNALAWSGSLLIATLFRVEGAFFFLLLPFSVWFDYSIAWKYRLQQFVKLYFIPLLAFFFFCLWFLFHPERTLSEFGRLQEIFQQLFFSWKVIANRYLQAKAALAQHVLTGDSINEAALVLIIIIFTWYVISVVSNLSWIYSLLVLYAWWKKVVSFSVHSLRTLYAYVLINLVITLGFLFERLFLSKRYLLALSLVLMLWVPFALNDLLKKKVFHARLISAFTFFLIFVSAIGGMWNFGYSKAYLFSAGQWLATNVQPKDALYTNDYQLMYYSRHFGNDIFKRIETDVNPHRIEHGRWRQFDYVALRIRRKHQQEFSTLLKEISIPPIKIFNNERGDQIAIYRIQ